MIGVLSDAHGNGPAFDRTIAVLKELGAESFRFIGDAVGYIPSLRVIDSLRELGACVRCIKGNHEQMLLSHHIDAGRDAVYQLSVLDSVISPKELSMIASWDLTSHEQLASRSVLFVHGSPSNPLNGYVYPDSDFTIFHPGAEIVFMGHSHRPFIRDCNGVRYVNVGSCGLPRDDGRFGSAAIYDLNSGLVRIVRFDITAETEAAFATSPPVHPSVREVLTRRSSLIFGDFI
jgi:putative phosphoesterase